MAGEAFQAAGYNMWKQIRTESKLNVLQQAARKAFDTGTGGSRVEYVIPQKHLGQAHDLIPLVGSKMTLIAAGTIERLASAHRRKLT